MSDTSRLQPITDARSREFFDAAAEGRLLIQRCRTCRTPQFYPRAHCTTCFSADIEWVEASGRGTLHTFSVVHKTPNPEFAADTPYVLAIVDLDEGVRMTSRVVDVPLDEVCCEMPVRVVFPDRAADGDTPMPMFTRQETDAPA